MKTLSASKARSQLYTLLAESAHEPITIMGKRGNAVLIAEADWAATQETLYLLTIPGMRESIIAGMKTPVKDCDIKLPWSSGK